MLFELQQAVDSYHFAHRQMQGVRRQADSLSGQSASANSGDPRTVNNRHRDCGAEEKKGEKAAG